MKKVILLTNEYPYGNGESFIEAEMNALDPHVQVEVVPMRAHMINSPKRKIPENVFLKDYFARSDKFILLKSIITALCSRDFWDERYTLRKYGVLSIKEMKKVLGYIMRGNYVFNIIEKKYRDELSNDSVVLYSYWLLHGAYAVSKLSQKYGCRAVSRAHGVDVWDGRSAFCTTPATKIMLKGLESVFVCSRDGQSYLQKKHPNWANVFHYSYLGTEDFGYKNGDNRGESFVIVSCARIEPVKRVYLLAEALKYITDKKITWIHFGDGSKRSEVENSIKNMPNNIEVQLKGMTLHEIVMKYYKDNPVNLFVNTSSSEGIPVSIMETLSFGIPVIATDVGGTREICVEETGILLNEDFQIEQLSNAIRHYIEMGSEEYCNVRKKARKFWEANFSASSNYKNFYSEILRED